MQTMSAILVPQYLNGFRVREVQANSIHIDRVTQRGPEAALR